MKNYDNHLGHINATLKMEEVSVELSVKEASVAPCVANFDGYMNSHVCVSGGKNSFFGKFSVLCFLETPVLRFALLPYYQRIKRYTNYHESGSFNVNLSCAKNAACQFSQQQFIFICKNETGHENKTVKACNIETKIIKLSRNVDPKHVLKMYIKHL